MTIVGEERSEIGIKHYCFDPSLSPPGKSVLIAMLTSSYDYWRRIYGHRWYDTEQTQVSDTIIDFLEGLYPGLRGRIEVVDEATPLSYERYTGNWQGSSCGWLLTKQTMPLMLRGVDKTLPGLNDFYMAGQWVEPGGSVPVVAMSGRNAIQMICHADGKPFVSDVPAEPPAVGDAGSGRILYRVTTWPAVRGRIARLHRPHCGEVVVARAIERRAVQHSIHKMALQCVDAVPREAAVYPRVLMHKARLAQRLEDDVALVVKGQMALAAVDAQFAEGQARVLAPRSRCSGWRRAWPLRRRRSRAPPARCPRPGCRG